MYIKVILLLIQIIFLIIAVINIINVYKTIKYDKKFQIANKEYQRVCDLVFNLHKKDVFKYYDKYLEFIVIIEHSSTTNISAKNLEESYSSKIVRIKDLYIDLIPEFKKEDRKNKLLDLLK